MNFDTKKWIYYNDENNKIRYILGTKWKKTVMCFWINPSTAEPENLDNTVKSVERLSISNGYDSWIMMNIYPQRATDPNNMHKNINPTIHEENLRCIKEIIQEQKIDIWWAWWNLIEKRRYLKNCLKDIYNLTYDYNCHWISIWQKTKQGHPHHPLYLKSDTLATNFDIQTYIENL